MTLLRHLSGDGKIGGRTKSEVLAVAKEEYPFPPLDYFQFGNVFCGSLGPLRWRAEPLPKADPPVIRVWKWRNGLCFEKREENCPEGEFPLSAGGLDQTIEWLAE